MSNTIFHNILYLLNTDLSIENIVIFTHNIHSLHHKYWDLHWSLTVDLQYHNNLLLRLDVELFADTREKAKNTQIFIVDYNSTKYKKTLEYKHVVNNCPKTFWVALVLQLFVNLKKVS